MIEKENSFKQFNVGLFVNLPFGNHELRSETFLMEPVSQPGKGAMGYMIKFGTNMMFNDQWNFVSGKLSQCCSQRTAPMRPLEFWVCACQAW